MLKWLKIIFVAIAFSMYFFPFEFTFLPGVNTKMAMAGLGVVFVIVALARQRGFIVPKSIFFILVLSSLVSIVALFSITFNRTEDYSYVGYIISASVWLSAAYVVCCLIKIVHGRVDIPLIVNYLTGVCVAQCVIALAVEFIPSVKAVVDAYIYGQNLFDELDRLYGIGAALDVAGLRFSLTLVCISAMIYYHGGGMGIGTLVFLVVSFFIIAIVGNMIARTTTVGLAVGLIFLTLAYLRPYRKVSKTSMGRFFSGVGILVAVFVVSVFLYNSIPVVHKMLRFAFEGFFSLYETGQWDVSSNEKLQTMVVFPDNLKTWIVGDGYFLNSRYDINYLGNATELGFYMGTDIGYLRFIFYFGLLGLVAVLLLFIYTAVFCVNSMPEYKFMFVLSLVVGLLVWLKVATDVFLIFALFVCVIEMNKEEENEDNLLHSGVL